VCSEISDCDWFWSPPVSIYTYTYAYSEDCLPFYRQIQGVFCSTVSGFADIVTRCKSVRAEGRKGCSREQGRICRIDWSIQRTKNNGRVTGLRGSSNECIRMLCTGNRGARRERKREGNQVNLEVSIYMGAIGEGTYSAEAYPLYVIRHVAS
jgi:hypothetical protein